MVPRAYFFMFLLFHLLHAVETLSLLDTRVERQVERLGHRRIHLYTEDRRERAEKDERKKKTSCLRKGAPPSPAFVVNRMQSL